MGIGKQPKGKDAGASPRASRSPASGAGPKPEWADGLRKLYDEVVDEPLPDSFKDLLSRLDDPIQDRKN